MKINIIVDNKNSWFYPKAKGLVKKLKNIGGRVKLLTGADKIKKGSDASFFLSYEKYITAKTREKSKYNIVIHASDLPKRKGMSPATWQILEGKKKIPVTLFEVGDGFDDGDYYFKDNFLLSGTELISEWRDKLYFCIEQIIFKFIKNKDRLKPIKQKGKSTKYKRRTPEDSRLNMNKSLRSQFNLLRVVDNERYPAFFDYKNNQYILKIYKK